MHITRDRPLTPDEGERYRQIREDELAKKDETIRELQPVIEEYRSLQNCISALKQAREAKGISRQEVASLTHVEPGVIEAIEEHREVNPSIGLLSNYATAVGRHLTLVLSDAVSAK